MRFDLSYVLNKTSENNRKNFVKNDDIILTEYVVIYRIYFCSYQVRGKIHFNPNIILYIERTQTNKHKIDNNRKNDYKGVIRESRRISVSGFSDYAFLIFQGFKPKSRCACTKSLLNLKPVKISQRFSEMKKWRMRKWNLWMEHGKKKSIPGRNS